MSDQGTPKEECLYCHGINKFFGSCPMCGETLPPGEPKVVEFKRMDQLPFTQGNYYLEFSPSHPHV